MNVRLMIMLVPSTGPASYRELPQHRTLCRIWLHWQLKADPNEADALHAGAVHCAGTAGANTGLNETLPHALNGDQLDCQKLATIRPLRDQD